LDGFDEDDGGEQKEIPTMSLMKESLGGDIDFDEDEQTVIDRTNEFKRQMSMVEKKTIAKAVERAKI